MSKRSFAQFKENSRRAAKMIWLVESSLFFDKKQYFALLSGLSVSDAINENSPDVISDASG